MMSLACADPTHLNHGDMYDLRYSVPSISLYNGALTRSFLAFYGSSGSFLNGRNPRIGTLQLSSSSWVTSTSINPALEPSELEAPSMNNFYAFSNSVSSSELDLVLPQFYRPFGYTRASMSFSSSGYSSSAPCTVRLTKYTGTCFFPLSAINSALMLSSEAARYTIKVSPLTGAVTIGSASKSSFILRKALSAFVVHWIIFPLVQFFRVHMMGRVFSAPFERKRFIVANFLPRLCISLTDLGSCKSNIALTFEGFALISCLVMRCPENLPTSTLKEHFFGSSFRLITRSLSRFSLISTSISSSESLFMTISSALTSMFHPTWKLNTLSISL
ncbi:hypothetical protein Tco_0536986 [Tanacetum coccineum]